ncbi:unnamed protein product [Chironomus riparius]|uniref:G-protein coupled receptors family 1 profile domain-containing protein n=1 Tax=Chironomus riparius TaxID=315576 RepID=A0A9P0NMC5_9DIPT|nr:unnamed protein product [Chironomus riparius]
MDYLSANLNINETAEEFLSYLGNSSSTDIFGNLSDAHNNESFASTTALTPHTIFRNGYPSGYTITSIIFASVIVTILMIVIVVGNMLVIIAIATEKALKNIQNWFIASLAVADFFLGLVIMPFSLANELMGYWVFGSWWCDIHSAADVLLCTASIMNLCLISLDRYWSITQAVEYLKTRTPARAAVMIAAVWIMSGLICIPPLLGWKAKRPEGDLPQCQLSEDIGYVLYSALGSFYIPSCIMVFVYIRIYYAAKARARRGIRKQPRKLPNEQETKFSNPRTNIPMPPGPSASKECSMHPSQIATIEQPPNNGSTTCNNNGLPDQQVPGTSANISIPMVTCDFASDVSTSEAGAENENDIYKDRLQVDSVASPQDGKSRLALSINDTSNYDSSANVNSTMFIEKSYASDIKKSSPNIGRCRALSVNIDTDAVSEFEPSSSDSGVASRCAVVKPLKFRLCQPIFGKRFTKSTNKEQNLNHHHHHHHHHQHNKKVKNQNKNQKSVSTGMPSNCEIEPAIPKVKQRDPEKEKRRIARKKEKRATLILGLIMGSFIACWLPFFFLYILTPACPTCEIPSWAFALAFWLGYMNSALNPAIYTIFNKDFRRAFRRILFK